MGWTVEIDGLRVCITCNERRPVEEYYSYPYTTRQGKRSERRESRCIMCSRRRRAVFRATNRSAHIEALRAYRAADPERTKRQRLQHRLSDPEAYRLMKRSAQQKRKAASRMAAHENREMIARVLDEARFCGGFLDAYSGEIIEIPQVDHVEPLARGGLHCYENLCVTSAFNNGSKHALPLIVWMATR